MGDEILQALKSMNDDGIAAARWESIYTGIQVICNRLTPSHRDSKGRAEWYDLLVGLSTTSLPYLVVSELGLEMAYYPGTVVGLCGNVLEHGVRSWGSGDRICYAHFMREAVRKHFGIPAAGWAMLSKYD